MKRLLYFILTVLLCSPVVSAEDFTPSICPTPAEAVISATEYSPLDRVAIYCQDPSAAKEWACRHLKQWFGAYAPAVTCDRILVRTPEEGTYSLNIHNGSVRLSAGNLEGVRNALYSLRQIAIPARGSRTVQGWIVPETRIEDGPALKFRGLHLCWFPETEAVEIERKIRLAAYYKFNYVVIEPWGTFRSETHPWLFWPDAKMTKAEIKRLCGIADDLGVRLIPLFNIFGHASGSRVLSGKHCALDFAPEYQPLFEPEGGWNWCLSNPETIKVQSEVILEMLEAFGNPEFFHIGCDEAEAPSCPDCMNSRYSELLVNHIGAVCRLLSERGVRPMMWHDMLLDREDRRWTGFYANGNDRTAAAVDRLSKDIVICDWYYKNAREDYPTLDYFKDKGFDVLTCSSHSTDGILSQGLYARKAGLFGILGTTWQRCYGTTFVHNINQLADAAWSARPQKNPDKGHSVRLRLGTHLRQIGWDIGIADYGHCGFYNTQVARETDTDR